MQKVYNLRIGRSESDFRKQTLLNRYYEIEEHNASGNATYTQSINEFSHLTEEELASQKTGYIHRPEDHSDNYVEPSTGRGSRAAPASFDWRNTANVVRPVQNQGNCGSCWAFAAIGAIEGQMALKKKRYDKLSEQEIIECVTNGNSLLGCNGGWDAAVYNHAKARSGVTSAALDPYAATTNGRKCNLSRTRTPGSTVASWKYVSANNEALIRDTLVANGPMYIIFTVVNNFYSYSGGIYSDPGNTCSGRSPNHAVLLVGYGSQNGVDYWILKNSWGTGWGEGGYFR